MSSAATTKQGFSNEELAELLPLIRGSDSVELKVTVPDSQLRSTVTALGMDPMDAQLRQAVFLDTPDLTLDKHGVVIRARRIQGKGEDSVVKLRPVVPEHLPAEVRKSPAFRVEVDANPGGFVCSATLKGALRGADVKAALAEVGNATVRAIRVLDPKHAEAQSHGMMARSRVMSPSSCAALR